MACSPLEEPRDCEDERQEVFKKASKKSVCIDDDLRYSFMEADAKESCASHVSSKTLSRFFSEFNALHKSHKRMTAKLNGITTAVTALAEEAHIDDVKFKVLLRELHATAKGATELRDFASTSPRGSPLGGSPRMSSLDRQGSHLLEPPGLNLGDARDLPTLKKPSKQRLRESSPEDSADRVVYMNGHGTSAPDFDARASKDFDVDAALKEVDGGGRVTVKGEGEFSPRLSRIQASRAAWGEPQACDDEPEAAKEESMNGGSPDGGSPNGGSPNGGSPNVRGNGRTNKMQAHGVSAETISTKDTECPSSQVPLDGPNGFGGELEPALEERLMDVRFASAIDMPVDPVYDDETTADTPMGRGVTFGASSRADGPRDSRMSKGRASISAMSSLGLDLGRSVAGSIRSLGGGPKVKAPPARISAGAKFAKANTGAAFANSRRGEDRDWEEFGPITVRTIPGLSAYGRPSWILKWSCLLVLCAVFDVLVLPYAWIMRFDVEGIAPDVPLVIRILTHFSSLVFLADMGAVSWRLNFSDGKRRPSAVLRTYAGSWLFVDAIATFPWDLVAGVIPLPAVIAARVLRTTRLRCSYPILDDAYASVFRKLRQNYLLLVGTATAVLMHICACAWCASSLHARALAHRDNLDGQHRSWIDEKLGMVGLEEDDDHPLGYHAADIYLWSVYYAISTFTTIGYGDITPQNSTEAVASSFIMLGGALAFGAGLAVITSLVSAKFQALTVLNQKAKSWQQYSTWRKLPADLQRSMGKTAHGLLPDSSGPLQLAEYEKSMMKGLTADDTARLKMHLYAEVVRNAPFLTWMSPFPVAVKEVVDCTVSVMYPAGALLFERGDEIGQLTWVLSGSVSIADVSPDEDRNEAALLSTMRRPSLGIGLLAMNGNAEAKRLMMKGDGDLTQTESEDEDDEDSDSDGSDDSSLSLGARSCVSSASGWKTGRSIRVGSLSSAYTDEARWEFATKQMERLDAQSEAGSDETDQVEEANIVNAPVVFGEPAIWSLGVKTEFAARSTTHAEVVQIALSSIWHLAHRDKNIGARFRAYRTAIRNMSGKQHRKKPGKGNSPSIAGDRKKSKF